MMFRFLRKRVIIPLVTLGFIASFVLIVGKGAFSFTSAPSSEDFSDVLSQGEIDNTAKVIDIGMLGAHDAFSNQITTASSVDPAEDSGSIVNNSTVRVLADGVFVRLAKAQKSDAKQLLEKGVRYFDVRISYFENEWYTKHALISGKLSDYLSQIITFLGEHPGEFIVFDIQHIYFGETMGWSDLFSYLDSFEVEGISLLDFLHYSPLSVTISDLTYGEVTTNGTQAGLVILGKNETTVDLPFHYNRGNGDTEVIAIRSFWHNTSNTDKLILGIQEESELIATSGVYDEIFRVNQAQKTGVLSGSELVDTLTGWSLLDMAANSNQLLIENENFSIWLTAMPILMVDYADSAKGNFNVLVNQAMISYNQGLVV